MRVQKSNDIDFQPWGLSPLGGNAKEGTANGFAPVRNTETMGVPLVYDSRVDACISKIDQQRLDDKEHALRLAEKMNDDEKFRRMAGFTS
jgi:hypothetical protein